MLRYFLLVTVVCSVLSSAESLAQDDRIVSDLTQKQLALGVSLLQRSTSDKNRAISPYSIHSGLMLARIGAKGETARQLDSVLSAVPYSAEVLSTYSALNSKVLSSQEEVSVSLANSIWITDRGDFTPEFTRDTSAGFSAKSERIDFTQSEDARQTINSWVSEQTKKLIPNLIPSGAITKNTIATLVNALHFKASWRTPFSEKATKDEQFWITPTTPVMTSMMHTTESLGYFENKEWQGVQVEYVGAGYSYVVLVPKRRLSVGEVSSKLSAKLISEAHLSSTRARVTLSLPRHSIREAQDVATSLQGMGIKVPFSAEADFSGMTSEPTTISSVQHESVVIVDEKGTEAAAATAVLMMKTAAIINPEPPKEVKADRPFVFAIMHSETKAPLFLGIVGDPR
jgi:serpin B